MEKITTTEAAIKFLEEKAGISTEDISKYKYKIFDEDFADYIKTDKELIEYANEQQEAIEEGFEDNTKDNNENPYGHD